MAVGMIKADQRRAGHLKIFQHAVINQDDAMGSHAFIVIFVISEQIGRSEFAHGGVVNNAQERRQNLLAHFFREGLAFRYVFLAMPFCAMAEYFMEEDRRRTAGQESWAYGRLVDRRND